MTGIARYAIAATVAAAFATGMCFLLHETREQRSLIACNALSVNFMDSLRFVSEQDIREYIAASYGDYNGQRLDSVGLARIEEILESKSAVMNTEAWLSDDGTLHLDVTQRAPALRFQNGEKGFYVDDRGYIFPLHPSYTAPVPVVNGSIPVRMEEGYKGEAGSVEERMWIQGMLGLNGYITGSKLWKDRISGIDVRDNGDILLTINGRDEIFIFGDSGSTAEKFSKIGKYFDYILPDKGDGYYKTVNVKYNKQIVCRKDM